MGTRNAERDERIILMREEGISYDAIAAHLDVTRNVVAGVLKRAGKTDHSSYRSHNTPRERVPASTKDRVVADYVGGKTGKDIAREYGFHPHTANLWRREAGIAPKLTLKLSADDVVEIRAMRASGSKLKDIADRFGVHLSHVCKIARGNARA